MTVFEAESDKVTTNELPMMANENCIEWLKGDTVATVSLCQKKLQNKIRKYAESYPELFQIEEERAFSTKFAPFIHAGNVEEIMNQLDYFQKVSFNSLN